MKLSEDEDSYAADPPVDRKRARTPSSLEFKVGGADRSKLTTTAPTKKKPPPLTEYQKQQILEEQHQQEKKKKIQTRAQTGSLPPRDHRFTVSDLEDMDADQLTQAFYEDPQLAMIAHSAGKQYLLEKAGYPFYGPDDAYPEHVQKLFEEGYPIKQYVILFVLLVFGIYQLRKSGPSRSTKAGSGAKKGKKGIVKVRSTPNTKEKAAPIEEELVELLASEPQKTPKDAKKLNRSSSHKKKKVRQAKKMPKPTNLAPQEAPAPVKVEKANPSPDSVSTDDSSSPDLTTEVEAETRNIAQHVAPLVPSIVDEEIAVDDDDGWKTVGNKADKASKPAVTDTKDTPARRNVDQTTSRGTEATPGKAADNGKSDNKQGDVAKASDPSSSDSAPASDQSKPKGAEPPGQQPVRDNGENPAKKPQQESNAKPEPVESISKKPEAAANNGAPSKKPSAEKAASPPKHPDSVENDEALAMQLQQEEEAWAEKVESETKEETWEEVTPKKGKRKDVTA